MSPKVKTNPTSSSRKNNNRSQTAVRKNSRRNSQSLATSEGVARKKRHNKSRRKKAKTEFAKNPKNRANNLRKKRLNKNPVVVPPLVALISRIAILTIGVSTILGSAISVANSLNSNSQIENTKLSSTNRNVEDSNLGNLENVFSLIAVGQKITPLTKQLQAVTQKYDRLDAGILIADVSDKSYVSIAGTETFSAASMIKLPILIAFFQDVDAEKIALNESLTVTKKNMARGSGYMRYQPIGTKFSSLKTATAMITVSDNTATNMVIERLGGTEALNQRFMDWGLHATKIRNPLPDLNGTNISSPEDLANLLLKIDRGELVSEDSRDRILKIMQQTERNDLLPQGLPKNSTIAHKTGDIGSTLGNTGIVSLPNGKRYIASVFVKRPKNAPQAQSLIQEISRVSSQYFQRQQLKPSRQSGKSSSFLAE